MNLEEMMTAARQEARDLFEPYLWLDDELVRFANEAESEAARRARLITDTLTDSDNADTPVPLCLYNLTAGQSIITLHPKILFVRRVKLGSKDVPLPKISRRDLDAIAPGWESHDAGDVVAYCSDYQRKKLVLYAASAAIDTVRLTVVRTPLGMSDPTQDSPEIDERFHDSLVHWMLHRMYLKPGDETYDEKKSADHLAVFEREFGAKSSAIDEQWINEHHGYDDFEGLF